MFPVFSEKAVKIKHHNKIFDVPKLSILQYSQVVQIVNETETSVKNSISEKKAQRIIKEASGKLIAVIKDKLPVEIIRKKRIFSYSQLVDLCVHMAFGSFLDGKITHEVRKYYEPAKLPDYEFLTMRILSCFKGYTLEKLLNEPASTFFALLEGTKRVMADNSIELIAEGVRGAFNDLDNLKKKRGSLKLNNPRHTPLDTANEKKEEMKKFLISYKELKNVNI
jgi:phage gp36-like protein